MSMRASNTTAFQVGLCCARPHWPWACGGTDCATCCSQGGKQQGCPANRAGFHARAVCRGLAGRCIAGRCRFEGVRGGRGRAHRCCRVCRSGCRVGGGDVVVGAGRGGRVNVAPVPAVHRHQPLKFRLALCPRWMDSSPLSGRTLATVSGAVSGMFRRRSFVPVLSRATRPMFNASGAASSAASADT